ncbi:MAG: DUF3810 domain-containing protein, partial [Clostridiaceae bacterium]|nr:DUF3810 domain-containing protein [Clostridiaceae bacterium]
MNATLAHSSVTESRRMLPVTVQRAVIAGVLCILAFAANAIFRSSPALADGYAEIFQYVAVLLSGAFSYLPFLLAEVLLYAAITGVCIYLVIEIFFILTRGAKLARVFRMLANFAVAASLLWFVFVMTYGFAYHCSPLSEKLELSPEPTAVETLYETTSWLMREATALSVTVPRDVSGSMTFGTFDAIADTIASGYHTLSSEYAIYRSTYAPVKRVSSWRAMSSFGITGIYIPFTAESAVNPDNTVPALPFTMAHEMAHRLMIAPEDEANFSAFLACRANSDRRVRYSGYFMAYRYCINALYAADPALAISVMEQASPQMNHDLDELNALIAKYESPVKDIGTAVNNGYLKANSQPSGVRSYGEVVDLLIALYTKENPAA